MKLSAAGGLLLMGIPSGGTQSNLVPACAIDCIGDLLDYTTNVKAVCDAVPKQRSLFQCLASSCPTDSYGFALLHTITACSNLGANISTLHPVELHHIRRQIIPTAPGPVILEPYSSDGSDGSDGSSRLLNFEAQFSVPVDCNAGSDGVITLSLPAPVAVPTAPYVPNTGTGAAGDSNAGTGAPDGQALPQPTTTSPIAGQPGSGDPSGVDTGAVSGTSPDSGPNGPDCDDDASGSSSNSSSAEDGSDPNGSDDGAADPSTAFPTPNGSDLDCDDDGNGGPSASPPATGSSNTTDPQASPGAPDDPNGSIGGQSSGSEDLNADCDDEDGHSTSGSGLGVPNEQIPSTPAGDSSVQSGQTIPSNPPAAQQGSGDPDCDPSDESASSSGQSVPNQPPSSTSGDNTQHSGGESGPIDPDCEDTGTGATTAPAPGSQNQGSSGSGGSPSATSSTPQAGQDNGDEAACDEADGSASVPVQGDNSGSVGAPNPLPSDIQTPDSVAGGPEDPAAEDDDCADDTPEDTSDGTTAPIIPLPLPSGPQNDGTQGQIAEPVNQADCNVGADIGSCPDQGASPPPTVVSPPSLPETATGNPNGCDDSVNDYSCQNYDSNGSNAPVTGSDDPSGSNGQPQTSSPVSNPSVYSGSLSDWLAGLYGSSPDDDGNACSSDGSQCANDVGTPGLDTPNAPISTSPNSSPSAPPSSNSGSAPGNTQGQGGDDLSNPTANSPTYGQVSPGNNGEDFSPSTPNGPGGAGASAATDGNGFGYVFPLPPAASPTIFDGVSPSGISATGSLNPSGDSGEEPCDDGDLSAASGVGNQASQVTAATLWPEATDAGSPVTAGTLASEVGSPASQAVEATLWPPANGATASNNGSPAPTAVQQPNTFITAARPMNTENSPVGGYPTSLVQPPNPSIVASSPSAAGDPSAAAVPNPSVYAGDGSEGPLATNGPQLPAGYDAYSPLEDQAYSRHRARDIAQRHEEQVDSRVESGQSNPETTSLAVRSETTAAEKTIEDASTPTDAPLPTSSTTNLLHPIVLVCFCAMLVVGGIA